jgi:Heavy metal associated domain 2
MQLRIVTHFPGRLRVRAERFREPPVGAEVAERVRVEPGVEAATIAERTGSLLVEYRPRELQLPKLIEIILKVGGLETVAADRGLVGAPQGEQVREVLGRWNEQVIGVTRGRVDTRTAVPGTLASLGLLRLLTGPRTMPEWYDLLFWSFVTFVNLNPPKPDDGQNPFAR